MEITEEVLKRIFQDAFTNALYRTITKILDTAKVTIEDDVVRDIEEAVNKKPLKKYRSKEELSEVIAQAALDSVNARLPQLEEITPESYAKTFMTVKKRIERDMALHCRNYSSSAGNDSKRFSQSRNTSTVRVNAQQEQQSEYYNAYDVYRKKSGPNDASMMFGVIVFAMFIGALAFGVSYFWLGQLIDLPVIVHVLIAFFVAMVSWVIIAWVKRKRE